MGSYSTGEEWIEVTVRDWDGRKLYRERAYKLNQKKIKEISDTLRDKFSISLGTASSIRIESVKAKQEEEMKMVRERVRIRKAQIGNAVKKMLFPKKESKQNLNTTCS